jgi:hypothetical protein
MLLAAFAIGVAATTYGQEATLGLELTPNGPSRASGSRLSSSSYLGGVDVRCTVTVWIEGEWSPWLWAIVYLDVDGSQTSAQDVGYWYVSATAWLSVELATSTRPAQCSADTISGWLSASQDIPGIPDGETSEEGGWNEQEYQGTAMRWIQTLTPSGDHYEGRVVNEQNGGGGIDTCFNNAPWAPFLPMDRVRPRGAGWQVGSNRWGPDRVGYIPQAVEFYRNNGAAPCDFHLNQVMVIDFLSNQMEYTTNELAAGITSISVWSERLGQYAERIWP